VPADIEVTAEIDGPYRYKLRHQWNKGGRLVLWCMMNPSDARIEFTDATVAKCGRLSRRWGFDGLLVGNACAYRHKLPTALLTISDPVGTRNLAAITEMASEAELIIVAHGRLPRGLEIHAQAMVECLLSGPEAHKLRVLKRLPDGCPAHPLGREKGHIAEDSQPIPWCHDGITPDDRQ
jgi:hypothetical protein